MVNRGRRGVPIEGVRIPMSGQKRGITRSMKAVIHRRSAIEPVIGPVIGHVRKNGRRVRYPLKGALGDALRAVHNLHIVLAQLRLLCARIGIAWRALVAALTLTLTLTATLHHCALG